MTEALERARKGEEMSKFPGVKRIRESTGWAIERRQSNPLTPAFLLGKLWCGKLKEIPVNLRGYRTAVYNTRAEAREAAKRYTHGKFRVRKVRVIVEVLDS